MIVLLMFAGMVAGALSALLGIGGGLVLVPILVFLFGLSQKQAQGTTLAMLVLPVTVFAAVSYFKAGYVNIKMALILALGYAIGALIIGHVSANKIPEATLTRVFGALLLVTACKMLFFTR